ncbi:16349_t:CDS:1, partial [Dentiscutata heterogama]
KLEKELKKLFRNKEKGREQQQLPSITNLQKKYIDLDKTWKKIQRAIQKVAKSTLPKKEKIPKLQDHQIENEKLKDLRKDIRVTGKWCRKLKKPLHFENTTNSYEEEVSKEAREWLAVLKDKYIEDQSEAGTQDCQEETNDRRELEIWWKSLYKTWQSKKRKAEKKEIQEHIERRHAII